MKNKSLTKNSIYYLVYNALNVIFPFITGIYVARVLYPSDIGLIEKARNLVQYFVIFSFLGIPTYGLKEISKYRKDEKMLNKTYSELMIMNTFSTTICILIYFFMIISIQYLHENIKLYILVGIQIFLNYFNNSWLYEGLEEFKYISIRNLIFKIVSMGLLILFVKSPDDYLIYAFITVIGTAGNYILNIINSKKHVRFVVKNLNLKQHMSSIAYLVVVNLAIEIYSLVDITMIGIFCENETVAYYSYGIKIYRILLQIINTFTVVIVPRISLYYKEGKIDKFNNLLSKTLKIIVMISFPMIIGIQFTSGYLITRIYGDSYIRSSVVLNIVSLILLISPIGYLLGSRVLLVTNNEKKMVLPVILGAITNVILNYLLINMFEEIGAAIASVIGEIVVMTAYIILGRKYFKLKGLEISIARVILSGCLMTLYLFITSRIHLNLLIITSIQIIGACIIYVILLYVLKEEIIHEVLGEKILMKVGKKWKKIES